jgi:hypothetical protein
MNVQVDQKVKQVDHKNYSWLRLKDAVLPHEVINSIPFEELLLHNSREAREVSISNLTRRQADYFLNNQPLVTYAQTHFIFQN